MTAMLKNLSHMSWLGMFDEDEENKMKHKEDQPLYIVTEAFKNPQKIQHQYLHPFQILKALMAYEKGE